MAGESSAGVAGKGKPVALSVGRRDPGRVARITLEDHLAKPVGGKIHRGQEWLIELEADGQRFAHSTSCIQRRSGHFVEEAASASIRNLWACQSGFRRK